MSSIIAPSLSLSKLLLDLLFPHYCCHCQRLGSLLCSDCYETITFHTLPLTLKLEDQQLDTMTAAGLFAGPLKSLLLQLKYGGIKDVARILGRLLHHTTLVPSCDAITAIPLHPKRYHERGFNQAQLIAQELATCSGLPYTELLCRTKHLSKQADVTDRHERLTRLAGIFEYATPFKEAAPPERVLLIDDVTTTGSTLNEAAKILKAHGVKYVAGLVVAHGS